MIDIPWGGVAAIVAQDLDGDGKPEIFVGTGADHGDVLLSGEGRKRWRLSGTTKIALTADLAGDRKEQIIVGGPMQAGPLRSIDSSNGSVVWNVGIDDDVKAIIPLRETDAGKSELLVGYAASGLWRVDSSGGKRRIRSFPSLVNTVIPLANGRSVAPEFAVGCEDGSVFVVDETGTIRASLAAGRPVTAIRSFQDGGKTCLFVATRGGAATAMELTGKASSYPRAGPSLP
jgi:hypothetical protein